MELAGYFDETQVAELGFVSRHQSRTLAGQQLTRRNGRRWAGTSRSSLPSEIGKRPKAVRRPEARQGQRL